MCKEEPLLGHAFDTVLVKLLNFSASASHLQNWVEDGLSHWDEMRLH